MTNLYRSFIHELGTIDGFEPVGQMYDANIQVVTLVYRRDYQRHSVELTKEECTIASTKDRLIALIGEKLRENLKPKVKRVVRDGNLLKADAKPQGDDGELAKKTGKKSSPRGSNKKDSKGKGEKKKKGGAKSKKK